MQATVRINSERGFTLIELVVVCALLAVLAAILYGTIAGLLRGRGLIDQQRQTGRTAHYALERMARELTARAAVPLALDDETGSPSPSPTPAATPAFAPRSFLIGTRNQDGDTNSDRIRFVSSNATQAAFGEFPNYGTVEVEYRLEDPDTARFSADKSKLKQRVLVREERPGDVTNKDIRKQRTAAIPLADGVVGLRFRYMLNDEWQDQWNQGQVYLPEAVEITLEFAGAEDQIERYRTAVALSRRRRR